VCVLSISQVGGKNGFLFIYSITGGFPWNRLWKTIDYRLQISVGTGYDCVPYTTVVELIRQREIDVACKGGRELMREA
jgi:hypothetical protein